MATVRTELPIYHPTPPPRGDLTRAPVIGRFLRWKHARTAVQIPMLLLAAVIVADGLFGPALAPQNAAGVLPWVHWRGFTVLALLVVGNLFCMACPFMLPRRLAKKLLPADRSWPSWLKTKWLALGLLVLFFWGYEALDLWNSPWLTAWIVVAYFTAAFVIDGFFQGAAFCKHVCPIGSFNFVNSLASPGEVRVRDVAVCESCETKDCIAGRHEIDPRTGESRQVQSGCELWLFQPRKAGNMDCTFCLDCVQACPYENVGIVARLPGSELVRDRWRSGIGRLTERPDVVALAMVVVFAAFVNAAGMIQPMAAVQAAIGGALGTSSEPVIWTMVLVLGLGVVPAALLWATGALSRSLAGATASGEAAGASVAAGDASSAGEASSNAGELSTRHVVMRMAMGLVPVGLGMWIAHYAFHFLAGGLAAVPVLQRAAADAGLAGAAGVGPDWTMGGLVPASWLLPLEIAVLEVGLLGSIVLLHYISRATFGSRRAARRAFVPWAALAAALAFAGVWIMNQPMAMRGMMPGMEMPGMEMPGMGAPGEAAIPYIEITGDGDTGDMGEMGDPSGG